MEEKSENILFIEECENFFDIYNSSNKNYINSIVKSITINYKTYLALLLVPYFLSYNNFVSGYIITILGLFYVYIGHYFYHSPFSFVFFFIHTYHHDHDDYASIYQEVIMEFLGITLFIILLSVLYDIDHINYLYDKYIILYYFFFYSSVHFFNYTFLKCNHYHSKHHAKINSNYFPDICDIIFSSKYNTDLNYIENTDHWFLNIVGSTFIVYLIKNYFEKQNLIEKQNFNFYFIVLYLLLATFMFKFAITNFFDIITLIDNKRNEEINTMLNKLII